MSRLPRTEPSLSEWAALGLLCERPRHGWAIARELAPGGEIGRVHSCTRALGYRALAQLREAGLVEERGHAVSDRGPTRTTLAPTRRGRAAFRRWRERAVEHVRDLRSELMLKLLFHERAGTDATPLLQAQTALLAQAELVLERQTRAASEFEHTLLLWRLSVVRAALSFVEALLDRRTVEPVVYRPIGVVASPHEELDGMPLQPVADEGGHSRVEIFEPHGGSLDDLEGFTHVWVVAHLHESTGWDTVVPTFLDDRTHGTFATRSPHRPNAIGLSLARIVAVEELAVVVDGIDLLNGTPVLDLKPYMAEFGPRGEIRQPAWSHELMEQYWSQ
jgi:tRNA-Thr(GGU) m(6)t(6)A37 methyltransferase TsaA